MPSAALTLERLRAQFAFATEERVHARFSLAEGLWTRAPLQMIAL